MATARPIQIDKNPVPDGETATVAVTFDVQNGVPDLGPLSLLLKDPSGNVASDLVGIIIKGHAGEATPEVVVGDVSGAWALTVEGGGTLTALGANRFSLSR